MTAFQETKDIAFYQDVFLCAKFFHTLTDEAGMITIFLYAYDLSAATIAAIKGETGSWGWALFAAGYTTALAWIVSAVVFQVGMLFM